MVYNNLCIFVLWTKVASAFEGNRLSVVASKALLEAVAGSALC